MACALPACRSAGCGVRNPGGYGHCAERVCHRDSAEPGKDATARSVACPTCENRRTLALWRRRRAAAEPGPDRVGLHRAQQGAGRRLGRRRRCADASGDRRRTPDRIQPVRSLFAVQPYESDDRRKTIQKYRRPSDEIGRDKSCHPGAGARSGADGLPAWPAARVRGRLHGGIRDGARRSDPVGCRTRRFLPCAGRSCITSCSRACRSAGSC